jgi:hypothetical protein
VEYYLQQLERKVDDDLEVVVERWNKRIWSFSFVVDYDHV